MKESTLRNKDTGKARRVSPRQELAVVTLAAVASISGVAGLLTASQHASTPVESGSASASRAITAPAPLKTHQRSLAAAQPSFRGDGGEVADDNGRAVFQPARKAKLVRRNTNVASSPTSHASPATVSQGSAPLN